MFTASSDITIRGLQCRARWPFLEVWCKGTRSSLVHSSHFLKTVLPLVLSYLRSLSANVFSTQLPLDDAVWSLLQKARPPFSRGLPAFSGEDITFLLSYFKTPSVGPASGIEPVPNILQSSALTTELTCPRLMESYKSCKSLPERVSGFFPSVIILAASYKPLERRTVWIFRSSVRPACLTMRYCALFCLVAPWERIVENPPFAYLRGCVWLWLLAPRERLVANTPFACVRGRVWLFVTMLFGAQGTTCGKYAFCLRACLCVTMPFGD